MIAFNRKIEITAKRALILLVFLIGFTLCGYSYATLDKESHPLDLDSGHWKVLRDSGWAGGSIGHVESLDENSHSVEFKYDLKATKSWPWPEIDFFIEFQRLRDLTKYIGVQLYIKAEKKQEVYFYFLTKDKNIEMFKPCWYRFILSTEYQKIYLKALSRNKRPWREGGLL